MMMAKRRDLFAFVRFLGAGGLNTLLTGALVTVLALVMPNQLAYTISYALGILFNVLLASKFVFQTKMNVRNVTAYVVMYVLVYFIGLGVVSLMAHWGWPDWTTGGVVFITAPLSFVFARLIFWGRGSAPPHAPQQPSHDIVEPTDDSDRAGKDSP